MKDKKTALKLVKPVETVNHLKHLVADPQNARLHNPRNIGTIVDSLHEVGAARSIVIGEHTKSERPAPLAAKAVRGADEPRMLRFLLATSVRRLKAARKLEETRKIVYPETTCIVRDVERLTRRLNDMTQPREVKTAIGGTVVAPPIMMTDDLPPLVMEDFE